MLVGGKGKKRKFDGKNQENAPPVAQSLPEPNLPGDGGEVRHDAGVILHQNLAVHDAPGGGAVPVLCVNCVINKSIRHFIFDFYLD